MSTLEDIINEIKLDFQGTEGTGALHVITGAPTIDDARASVAEMLKERDRWAAECLKLAEALNWEQVRYKPGHSVVAGNYGWLLFTAKANLTTLRDQVYPALKEALNSKRL